MILLWKFAGISCAALVILGACSRAESRPADPVSIVEGSDTATGADTLADAPTAPADGDAATESDAAPDVDTGPTSAPVAAGGLWVVDGAGQPVGVLVQRGHSGASAGGQLDILRDGVLVYSPKTGLFFGLQMATGKVLGPRLGVTDAGCSEPIVAGYYTDSDYTSGTDQAFVYKDKWYRIKSFSPLQLVTCGGTVPEGADVKCSPHNGSCRGFPVQGIQPPLPTSFSAPMAFAWMAGNG